MYVAHKGLTTKYDANSALSVITTLPDNYIYDNFATFYI
jgi:hypothetical protein